MPPGARVLIARVGLVTQERGANSLAHILADAGFETIVSAPGLTPAMVVDECLSLDVDVLVLSVSGQSVITLAPMVMKELRRFGARIPVVVSGVVIDHDLPLLHNAGIAATFGPAPTARHIVEVIQRVIAPPALLAG